MATRSVGSRAWLDRASGSRPLNFETTQAGAAMPFRIRLLQPAGQDRHLGLRLCERATRLEPADEVQLSVLFVREVGLAEDRTGGHEDVGGPAGARAFEVRRRDADDRVGRPSEREASADAARVSREPPLPEAVAQDDDLVVTGGRVFAREKEATRVWPESEHGEIAR